MWKLLFCLLALPGVVFAQSGSGNTNTSMAVDIPATPEFIENCASEVVMIAGVMRYVADCPAGGRLSAETLLTNRSDPDPAQWTSTGWDGGPVTVRIQFYNAGPTTAPQRLEFDAYAICRAFVPYTSETYDPIVPMPFQPETAVRVGHDLAPLGTGASRNVDLVVTPAGGCSLVDSIAAGEVFEIGFGAMFANDVPGLKVTLLDLIYETTD
ncbi:MAG TPA: hypothetical protein VHN13_00810 [Candidatus Tectomicrobia bacterium]|jgi:hypothetical protein|nr:hypothetical protein [Candidatus Tectomicrobia bacterium]